MWAQSLDRHCTSTELVPSPLERHFRRGLAPGPLAAINKNSQTSPKEVNKHKVNAIIKSNMA